MINAMRKVDHHRFLRLVMALEQAYNAKYPGRTGCFYLPLACWNDYNLLCNQYDTLSLKPYPIATDLNQYHQLPKGTQEGFAYY